LRLVYRSELRASPPRSPEQSIFDPVANFGFAGQIGCDRNTKCHPFAGYVTRFEAEAAKVLASSAASSAGASTKSCGFPRSGSTSSTGTASGASRSWTPPSGHVFAGSGRTDVCSKEGMTSRSSSYSRPRFAATGRGFELWSLTLTSQSFYTICSGGSGASPTGAFRTMSGNVRSQLSKVQVRKRSRRYLLQYLGNEDAA
jgi:hypothetical protein